MHTARVYFTFFFCIYYIYVSVQVPLTESAQINTTLLIIMIIASRCDLGYNVNTTYRDNHLPLRVTFIIFSIPNQDTLYGNTAHHERTIRTYISFSDGHCVLSPAVGGDVILHVQITVDAEACSQSGATTHNKSTGSTGLL